MKHRTKSGPNAAWLAAASATVIILHFGATGSSGGSLIPSASQQAVAQSHRTGAIGADWADWLEFMLMIHRLESLLTNPAGSPDGGSDKIQADAVASAQNQSARFVQSGLRASLSVAQIDEGFSALKDVRRAILDYPQSFTDPFWNHYLETLNALEFELDAYASGQSNRRSIR